MPPSAVLPDTTSEDCNFDADSFRLVHCRMDGPVPAQVRDIVMQSSVLLFCYMMWLHRLVTRKMCAATSICR